MTTKPFILSLPPSPRQLSAPFRMCGFTRFRVFVGAAITCFLVLTSLFFHRLPDQGALFLSSDNVQEHASERPIGYVQHSSEATEKVRQVSVKLSDGN